MPGTQDQVYARWRNEPERFWAEAADSVHWYRRWNRVLDASRPPYYRWFSGAVVNTCYNALDRHVASGRGDQPALIYDSPVTQTITCFTYRALLEQVSRFAGVLKGQGVGKGDRVIIYMPMVPEAAVAMLACARIGAIHSVVFGGFASHELAARISHAAPKVIVSASCGIEANRVVPYKPLLDKAIELATAKPSRCIMLQRPQERASLVPGRDADWSELIAGAQPADGVPVEATDPLYILYTSGTTGMPKGVVRDNGGHLVALTWSMKYIFGVEPGEVYWAASDLGWVVGHSYILYGPLFNGNTTILYEGKPVGTPDPGAFWRVISQHGGKTLFTAPTALRAIKKEDPRGEHLRRYDLSSFRYLFLAGERLDPDTYQWAANLLGVPVIDHWWQTETGWPIASNCMGIEPLPIKPGSPTKAVPGYDVRILAEDGSPVGPEVEGAVAIKLPLPPGTLPTLWGDDERFVRSYLTTFPGYYLTGDGGHIDEDGYLFVMGRIDDVINVAGHRLSTGSMEAVVATHPDVAECAVIGVADSLKGQVPVGFVVLKAGVNRAAEDVERELVELVRDQIGAVASLCQVLVVD